MFNLRKQNKNKPRFYCFYSRNIFFFHLKKHNSISHLFRFFKHDISVWNPFISGPALSKFVKIFYLMFSLAIDVSCPFFRSTERRMTGKCTESKSFSAVCTWGGMGRGGGRGYLSSHLPTSARIS